MGNLWNSSIPHPTCSSFKFQWQFLIMQTQQSKHMNHLQIDHCVSLTHPFVPSLVHLAGGKLRSGLYNGQFPFGVDMRPSSISSCNEIAWASHNPIADFCQSKAHLSQLMGLSDFQYIHSVHSTGLEWINSLPLRVHSFVLISCPSSMSGILPLNMLYVLHFTDKSFMIPEGNWPHLHQQYMAMNWIEM